MPKLLDKHLDDAHTAVLQRDIELKKAKPHLDRQLGTVRYLDKQIKKFEEMKQEEINRMEDLMELAVVSKHTLKDGFFIKPANTRKVYLKDIGKFLKWLKANRNPYEILAFFKDAFKITAVKNFCDDEANAQRLKGIMEPKIDGIELGGITYNRLTTGYPKEKKCKKK